MSDKIENQTGIVPVNPPAAAPLTAVVAPEVLKLREYGKAIVVATMATGEIYLQTVTHIRENKIDPATVRRELASVGFNKVRISEVIKVAGAADAVFDKYAARTIGFKGALNLTRDHLRAIAETFEQSSIAVPSDPMAFLEAPKVPVAGADPEVIEGTTPTIDPAAVGAATTSATTPATTPAAEPAKKRTPEEVAAHNREVALQRLKELFEGAVKTAEMNLVKSDRIIISGKDGWVVSLLNRSSIPAAKPRKGSGKGKEAK